MLKKGVEENDGNQVSSGNTRILGNICLKTYSLASEKKKPHGREENVGFGTQISVNSVIRTELSVNSVSATG